MHIQSYFIKTSNYHTSVQLVYSTNILKKKPRQKSFHSFLKQENTNPNCKNKPRKLQTAIYLFTAKHYGKQFKILSRTMLPTPHITKAIAQEKVVFLLPLLKLLLSAAHSFVKCLPCNILIFYLLPIRDFSTSVKSCLRM